MTEETQEEKVVAQKQSKKPASTQTPAPGALVGAQEKRFSFEQWAARKGVKAHHRGGLRAFVNNISKHRTLEEWDECFKAY